VLFAIVLANYVHNLDPVIFSFTDGIKLRWYGFAYLMAFLVGWFLLKKMGEKKLWALPGDKAADFISAAAFFGVFLGGRLGYLFFYDIAENGWGILADDPLLPLKVWKGGMSSHGGIIGLMVFTYFYSRKHKVSWTGIGDGLCVVAPLGLMFGRIANYINGELYGRVVKGGGGTMFPNALADDLKYQNKWSGHTLREFYGDVAEVAPELAPRLNPDSSKVSEVFALIRSYALENPELLEVYARYLQPRYPSQLYQAAGEGLALFLILFITRIKFPKLPHGVLTGMFFIFYAVFRILMEGFREPDASLIMGITKGQFYSVFMIAIGIAFIIWGKMKSRDLQDRSAA